MSKHPYMKYDDKNKKIWLWEPGEDEDWPDGLWLRAEYQVCDRCDGDGKHVNPAVDGNGISSHDEVWDDPDFADNYFGGTYDVVCEGCDGNRVVLEPAEDHQPMDPEASRVFLEMWRDLHEDQAIRRAEMGYQY